jgi:hypothetical protein
MYYEKVIPYIYLNKRLAATSVFRRDKIGATNAIKRALQQLIDTDLIREVSKQDCSKRFGTTQRSFIIVNMKIVD